MKVLPSPNHWTAREFQNHFLKYIFIPRPWWFLIFIEGNSYIVVFHQPLLTLEKALMCYKYSLNSNLYHAPQTHGHCIKLLVASSWTHGRRWQSVMAFLPGELTFGLSTLLNIILEKAITKQWVDTQSKNNLPSYSTCTFCSSLHLYSVLEKNCSICFYSETFHS